MSSLCSELYSNYYRLTTRTQKEYLMEHYGEWSFTLKDSTSPNSITLATSAVSEKLFQSEFGQITSFLTESLTWFLKNKKKFTRGQCVNFYCNLDEWNRKIAKHNKTINESKFWNTMERILSFAYLSIKCKPLELSGLNRYIWKLELAEKSRGQTHMPLQSISVPLQQTWAEWRDTHVNNYVAHAINSENVDQVLAVGKIVPSEQLVLETGSVNHEGSYYEDFKQVTTTFLHPEIILKMSRVQERYFDFDEMLTTGIKEEDVDRSINSCRLTNYANNEAAITGLSKLDLLFALQKNSLTLLDQRLSQIYQQAKGKEKAKLKFVLSKVRYQLFPLRNQKILDSVCCTKNRIAWEYGPVVVLRGKPEQIISHVENSAVKDAVELLAPFENDGQYFGLDLFHEDVRILGPKSLLAKHKQKYGSRIHYIEDLTSQERIAFEVDLSAHTKKTQVLLGRK